MKDIGTIDPIQGIDTKVSMLFAGTTDDLAVMLANVRNPAIIKNLPIRETIIPAASKDGVRCRRNIH